MPEAAVALKQGAGRLIRRESDRGILVVGDTRLVTKGYGKRLLAALPSMRRLESEQECDEALGVLIQLNLEMDRETIPDTSWSIKEKGQVHDE